MSDTLRLAGTPKYLLIAEDLREKVQKGEYPAGSFLPTEYELQQIYQVSRLTVRHAIDCLRQIGMIEVVRGRGTRVKSREFYQILDNQLRFTEVIQSQGLKPGTIVLGVKVVKATPEVAEALRVPNATPVFEIGRLRTANDQIISYHLSYLKADYSVDKHKLEQVLSLYRYLEEYYSVTILLTDDVISSERASRKIARLLDIKAGDPILVLNRIAYTANDQIIEYALSYIRSDRLKYKTRIYRRGQINL